MRSSIENNAQSPYKQWQLLLVEENAIHHHYIQIIPYKTFPLYLCVIMHEGSREKTLADHLSNKTTVSCW